MQTLDNIYYGKGEESMLLPHVGVSVGGVGVADGDIHMLSNWISCTKETVSNLWCILQTGESVFIVMLTKRKRGGRGRERSQLAKYNLIISCFHKLYSRHKKFPGQKCW